MEEPHEMHSMQRRTASTLQPLPAPATPTRVTLRSLRLGGQGPAPLQQPVGKLRADVTPQDRRDVGQEEDEAGLGERHANLLVQVLRKPHQREVVRPVVASVAEHRRPHRRLPAYPPPRHDPRDAGWFGAVLDVAALGFADGWVAGWGVSGPAAPCAEPQHAQPGLHQG